jgi:UDP-N-acetylmuramoylalanine--D-glutamate ligase
VSDFGKIKDKYKKDLIDNNIEWEEEGHTEDLILNATVVMKSPGIPDKSVWKRRTKNAQRHRQILSR